MKAVLKNMALLFVLIAFALSASGFRMIRHTCATCKIDEYTFLQPKTCGENYNLPTENEPVCCSDSHPDHASYDFNAVIHAVSCCTYEFEYFVVDKLIFPKILKLEVPVLSLAVLAAPLISSEPEEGQAFVAAFRHPPPPQFPGINYLVFIQQLKLDCC